jgi:hypothetical protein
MTESLEEAWKFERRFEYVIQRARKNSAMLEPFDNDQSDDQISLNNVVSIEAGR